MDLNLIILLLFVYLFILPSLSIMLSAKFLNAGNSGFIHSLSAYLSGLVITGLVAYSIVTFLKVSSDNLWLSILGILLTVFIYSIVLKTSFLNSFLINILSSIIWLIIVVFTLLILFKTLDFNVLEKNIYDMSEQLLGKSDNEEMDNDLSHLDGGLNLTEDSALE